MTLTSYPPFSKVTFVKAIDSFSYAGIVLVIVVVIFLPFTANTLISLLSLTSSQPLYYMGSVRPIASLSLSICLEFHKFHINRHLPPKFCLVFLLPLFYLFNVPRYLHFFFSFYLLITALGIQDEGEVIWYCYFFFDLSKKLLSILGSFRLSLKPRISLLGGSICLGIAGYSKSKLSTRSPRVSLYLLEIDKISNFSCLPNCLLEDTFLEDCPNTILTLRRYFSPGFSKSSIHP